MAREASFLMTAQSFRSASPLRPEGENRATYASVSAQSPPIASNGLSLDRRTESRL
jgi:hypothetical protein